MSMMIPRRARSVVPAALCLCVVLSVVSCSLFRRGSPADLKLAGEPTGSDLAAAARFVTTDDDVSRFFTRAMPDSGITAVRVAIRNDGSETLVVYSANGMKVAPGFDGLALVASGTTYLPMHPKDVVAKLVGAKKAERYRRHGVAGFTMSTFVPPLALYYIYGEIDIGRFYRPLFSKSFYPAREDGLFEPVRLEPGRERGGYLYFALPKGTKRDSCELLVRGCVAGAIRDTLIGSSFVFSRDELPLAENVVTGEPTADGAMPTPSSISCDAPYGYLFALSAGDKGGLNLRLARVRALNPQSDSLWSMVTPISAKSAAIADASCLGSLAAVAVNFKSTSKVYFLQCAEAPDVFAEHRFSRKIRHVYMHTGGAYVVTDDGVCHAYDGGSRAWKRGVKLGTDIDETGLVRGGMFSFLKKKELCVFAPSDAASLALAERHPLGARAGSVIGLFGGDLAVLDRVSKTRGDEISIFKVDTRSEISRGVLAGKVSAVATAGSSLVVELGDGTLLRIVRGQLGAFDITEAGYLPFRARVLKAAPHGFIAVGEAGEFAIGSIDGWGPGASGAIETSVKVR